ncbi:DUF1257 domain-containing protein [Leptolyngbya sp. AN02str]|uniref:DUF1257 domain-containing protein n=1 Tax=Leptolyngbya sp. AN02str TaxID=3423363 RepID=UPI003D319674
MSHFTSIRLIFKDAECIIQALNVLMPHWKFSVHEDAQHLYGYQNDKRPETAHIVVARQSISNASNDIGFLRNSDGAYTAIVSEWDQAILNWKDFLPKLQQEYGSLVAEKQLTAMGCIEVIRERGQDGQIQLRGRKPIETQKKKQVVRR